MSTVVWEATLDKRFACKVERVEEYKGKLTVKDTLVEHAPLLLDEEVTLSFNALFGPDVDDVRTWEDKCTEAVDRAMTDGFG